MKFSCQFRKHHSRTSEMNSLTPVPCLTEIIKKTLFLMLARHQLNIYKLSFEDRLEHLGWRNMIPPVLTSFLILEVGGKQEGVVWLCRMGWSWHTSGGVTVQTNSPFFGCLTACSKEKISHCFLTLVSIRYCLSNVELHVHKHVPSFSHQHLPFPKHSWHQQDAFVLEPPCF